MRTGASERDTASRDGSTGSTDRLAESTADLAARVGAGDRDAEGRLFSLYSDGLRLMLEQRTGDRELAADLAQDAFLVLLRRLREKPLNDPARLVAFLHKTARNILVAWQRKQVRRRTDIDVNVVSRHADVSPDQYQLVRIEETTALVRRLMDEMANDRDRSILHRYYILEHDKSDIRADMNLSEMHFYRVLHRARKRMRVLLEAEPAWQDAAS